MPTQEQRDAVRYDLDATEDSMEDSEIDSLFVRAEAKYSSDEAVEIAVRLMAINNLLLQAAKRTDYTQNRSIEKSSQIFDHLLKIRPLFIAQLKEVLNDNNAGVRFGGLRRKPKRLEEYPDDDDHWFTWGGIRVRD